MVAHPATRRIECTGRAQSLAGCAIAIVERLEGCQYRSLSKIDSSVCLCVRFACLDGLKLYLELR